jgi:hypothetical protein
MTRIGALRMESPLASHALAFGLIAALTLLLLAARSVQAATFSVTNTNDSGAGSLRQAITDANSNPGADTINISATGTINLQSPLPNLSSMEMNGPGASQLTVRRDQGGNYTVLSIFNQNVTINGITISNGHQTVFGGGGISVDSGGTLNLNGSVVSGNTASNATNDMWGGGIMNNGGTLTLTNSTVSSNAASSTGGISRGGGIANLGNLTLINSTVSGNTAGRGGGIYSQSFITPLTLTNSTVSGNTAGPNGGGGIQTEGPATLTNSTLNNNSGPSSGAANLYGASGAATLTFKNTIVANPQGGGPNCFSFGTKTSQGNNLEYPVTSSTTCGFTQPTDKLNQNPQLGTLQNNGGPTQTHALLAGSAAIDAGTNTGCPATDQRGVLRPRDGDNNGSFFCDIGAYEASGTLQPPSNDNFANAQRVSGPTTVSQTSTAAGTTAGATRETGEPDHYITNPPDSDFWAGDHSVWYGWTAPFSGSVSIETCQANIDSIVAVYTVSQLGNLTRVTDNNNHPDCPAGTFGSKVTFNATAGTTYRIAVGDAGGARENTFTLRVDYSPTVSSVTVPRRRGGNIKVQFSEPMNPTTLMQNPGVQPSTSTTILLFKGGAASTLQVGAKVRCTEASCRSAILDPDRRLAKRKKYTVRIEGAGDADGLVVEDPAGNELAQDYVRSFRSGLR